MLTSQEDLLAEQRAAAFRRLPEEDLGRIAATFEVLKQASKLRSAV